MDAKIRQFVYRVRARIREQMIIDKLMQMTGFGLLSAVFVSLLSLVVPFFYAVPVAAACIIIAVVFGIILGIKGTPSPMEAALKADAKGHKERISTAYYLTGREDAFSFLQKKDALSIIAGFRIRKEFPLKLRVKQVSVVIGLALIFTVSSLIDTPARDLARLRHEVQKEAKEEIARIEKVEKEIKENKEISEAESKEMKEQLDTAKQELNEADSYEELKKAEERLAKKMETASLKSESKAFSETLKKAAEETKEMSAKRKEELAKAAEEALKKAENGSEKDKKDAYDKLKQLAEMTGDSDLMSATENYAISEYSDLDYIKAQTALSETVNKMSEKKYDFAENQNNGQNSKNQNQNEEGQEGNQGSQNNSSESNQQGKQQGNQPGNQQGNSPGSGKSGSGNGNGNSGNSAGQGGAGTGAGWNRGSKNGQEGPKNTNENITVPDGEIGDDDNLTGKQNGNQTSLTSKSNQSMTWSGDKVSYGQVSAEYKDKAYKKVNGSNYPSKLKDKIKNYFDGLN